MKLTLEQLHERDHLADENLRAMVRQFLFVTKFDLSAIACAGRLYYASLFYAMQPNTFITESVYVRIVNGLEYLATKGVQR